MQLLNVSGFHLFLLCALLAACGPASAPGRPPADAAGPGAPAEERRGGTITIPITSGVPSMGIVGVASTTTGGWGAVTEIHSNGLITSDVHTRKAVGRLAEAVPSIDDGTMTVLPDGRMRVVYRLRKGVTWQDGAPFNAHDLVFSHQFNSDPGIPSIQEGFLKQIASVEAPDDHTFVMNFGGPYYRADQLGVRIFWPQPRHILGPAYERYQSSKNPEEIINLPYWTSEYVHLGPFRLASFDPADTIVFRAYDGFFLGKPKVDTIRVKIFTDLNTLFSNLLVGTVDVLLETTLEPDLGFQLMDRWAATGDGIAMVKKSAQRFLVPQVRPAVQIEPTTADVRTRAALYHALDRETLSEGLQSGHRELAAFDLLWAGEPLHEATKDGFRRYAYDPDRAKALLREVGWTPGPDGSLRHDSDGRRYRTALSGTIGRIEREVNGFSDYWRRIGIEVEQLTIPAAQVRNAEYRANYPGWEASAAGGGDEILGRLEGPAGSAQTRWIGNRGGYEDPRAQRLIDIYRTSLSEAARFQAMKAISDFMVEELPLLVMFSTAEHIAVRKGIRALEDHAGGDSAARPYGTHTRNAHLWEVL